MRHGFTQIELIFIMVIIGILAALALPRLAATRDDAALAKDVSNMAICIRDASSTYTATGVSLLDGDSQACNYVVCYTITYGTDGSNFNVDAAPNAATHCSRIVDFGGYLEGLYQFKAVSVSL